MSFDCPSDEVLTDVAIGAVSEALRIPPEDVRTQPLDLSDSMDAIDIATRIARTLKMPGSLVNGKFQRSLRPATTIDEVVSRVRDYAKTV